MPVRQCILLFVFALSTLSDTFGQLKLRENLVADSTAIKHRISMVIQDWFTGSAPDLEPAQTTTEYFDSTGRIIRRTYINYTYDRYESDFIYHKKKSFVRIKTTRYDWNPFRETRKGDTIVTRSVEKYDLLTGIRYDLRRTRFALFQPLLIMDTMSRVVQSADTIKFGYDIARYQYDSTGNLVEIRHFETRFSEEHELQMVYNYTYNDHGQIAKMILWTGYNRKDGYQMPGKEVETDYRYNDQGLLSEMLITTSHLSLKHNEPGTVVYRYRYGFH
jgi:hypothetical protein